jgi:hypothetical protein
MIAINYLSLWTAFTPIASHSFPCCHIGSIAQTPPPSKGTLGDFGVSALRAIAAIS